jgi:hypothetical protein
MLLVARERENCVDRYICQHNLINFSSDFFVDRTIICSVRSKHQKICIQFLLLMNLDLLSGF